MANQNGMVMCLAVALSLPGVTRTVGAQQDGWAKVKALPKGARVRVTSFDGARITGVVDQVGDDVVRVETEAAAPTSLARRDVRMLERLGRRSWKGTAIGAGLGAIAGVVTLVTVEPKDSRVPAARPYHEIPVMLATTGIGAGAGAVTDLIRRPPVEVLYVAPAPATTQHGKLIGLGYEIITGPNDRGGHGRGTGQPHGIAERHLRQSP